MKNIASWPSQYNYGLSVEELTIIYKNWLDKMEKLVAEDVHVHEFFNKSGLDLNAGNIVPPGNLSQDSIEWIIPFLTTEGEMLQYSQKARRLGWFPLDASTGTITLKPVGKPKVEYPIHRKPKVLIL